MVSNLLVSIEGELISPLREVHELLNGRVPLELFGLPYVNPNHELDSTLVSVYLFKVTHVLDADLFPHEELRIGMNGTRLTYFHDGISRLLRLI